MESRPGKLCGHPECCLRLLRQPALPQVHGSDMDDAWFTLTCMVKQKRFIPLSSRLRMLCCFKPGTGSGLHRRLQWSYWPLVVAIGNARHSAAFVRHPSNESLRAFPWLCFARRHLPLRYGRALGLLLAILCSLHTSIAMASRNTYLKLRQPVLDLVQAPQQPMSIRRAGVAAGWHRQVAPMCKGW